MSCSYNAYVCLNAQKLLNSYKNTYEPVTMKPTSDMMHNLPIPSTNVCKNIVRCALARLGFDAQAAQRPECEVGESADAEHLATRCCPARPRHRCGVDELRTAQRIERTAIP